MVFNSAPSDEKQSTDLAAESTIQNIAATIYVDSF